MSNGEFGKIESKLNSMDYKLSTMEHAINALEKLLQQILSKVDNVDHSISRLGL